MPDPSIPDQFSDDEVEQMKRYGQAQLGGTGFSDAVEKELAKFHKRREANAGKMHAAQTGGGDTGLGPSDMDTAAVKQRDAIQQQTDTQGQGKASQAQGGQTPPNAPPAPSGPIGTSKPYPVQAGPQPQAPATPPAPLPEPDEDEPPAPGGNGGPPPPQ